MTSETTTRGVEFTLITSTGPMSKAFRLDEATGIAEQVAPSGRPLGNGPGSGALTDGMARRVSLDTVADLAPILAGLTEKNLIVAGRIARGDIGQETQIASADIRERIRANGHDVSKIILRSADDLKYRAGLPALLGLDHDAGHLSPEYVARLRKAGGAHAVLMDLCPALVSVETLIAPSSSAGILREADDALARNSLSKHLWMIAQDGDPAILRAFVQRLHQRAILAGWGWVFVSRAGVPEVRSLIDVKASGLGERVWFSGPTILLEGLVQRDGARDPVLVHGGRGALDAASAMAPLDEGETVRLREIERGLIDAHAEEIARARSAHRERDRQRKKARGMGDAEIDRRHAAWERQELDGETTLTLDDGATVEVSEVLEDVSGFLRRHGNGNRVTLADPEEPDYGSGRNLAVMDDGNGRNPSVFSHAHGGRRFTLGWSVEDFRRRAGAVLDDALTGNGASRDQIAQRLLEALGPMLLRRLPSVGDTGIDAALAAAGAGMDWGEVLLIAPFARDLRARLEAMAFEVDVGRPPVGMGLNGGEVSLTMVNTLLAAEDATAMGGAMEAFAPGLGEALETFWVAARSVDPVGAERLQAAVAVAREASEQALRGIMGLHGQEALEDAQVDAGEAPAGGDAVDAGGEEDHDDDPLANWLPAGAAARKATQHNALRVLMGGLRLGKDKKGHARLRRDLRAGGILLSRVRKGSTAWKTLGLGRAKPSFIEPLTGQPVWEWTDDMTNAVVGWAQAGDVMVTAGVVHDAVVWAANKNRVDPVADYLQRLEKMKMWDGVPRLDGWLVRHGGAEEGPVGRRALAMFALGAVARALVPVEGATGDPAQVDTVMVLAGPQGGRKSEMMRVLARVLAWHSESVIGGLSNPENILVIHRSWITDISEGASLKKSEVTVIKQFITTRQDVMRMKYGRLPVALKRRGVLCCTVNDDGGGFLADGTGARRFMVCGVQRIDIERLKAEADLLWAEAVARYRAGEAWWVREDAEDGTDEAELRDAMAVTAEARRVKTAAEELVRRWLFERPGVSSNGRVVQWEPRPVPISVLPAGRVLDMLEQIGLDPVKDDYSPAKACRALSTMGWASVKVKQRGLEGLGLNRDGQVWLSPSGLAVLRQAREVEGRNGETAGSRFRRWAEEQYARGAVFGAGGVVDRDVMDRAGDGMGPEPG